jgi:outer membrane protein TolC
MKLLKMVRIFLLAVVISSLSNIFAQENQNYLETLIHEAIIKSPKIKEYESKLSTRISRIQIGTNLPDPTLTLGLMNLPTNAFSFEQEPMTSKIVGLSQGIPFPGKLSSKEAVKANDTSIVRQEIEDLKNKIRSEVSIRYFELQLVREEIELAEESIKLLSQISDVTKSNYEVSKSSLHNIIQVEVQITRVMDRIEELTGKADGLVAELNAMLLREQSSLIITNKNNAISGQKIELKSLITVSKQDRPFLKGITSAIDKARLMEEAAKYEFYPNFKFGIQYSQRDQISASGMNLNDFLSVVVGISLPINYGGKKTSKVNEAKYLQSQYLEKYNSSLQSLEMKFGKIIAKLEQLKVREKLVNTSLLPQSEQLLKAALADYQVAKVDFVNVIKAENDILKVKTDLAKIRAEHYKIMAELEFLTGNRILNSK